MRYKSEIFEVIHQDATEMFAIGAISAARMRDYDETCLIQEPKPAKEAPEIAEIERISSAPAGV
jgi:putative transcriptional regulator